MSVELLPLLPLQVVLFPNSILPLHIFEERYKQLINECVNEGKEFGINLAQENDLAKVGCAAVVTSVQKRYDNGRMDIRVQGGRRYRLAEVVPSLRLYSVGRIEFLEQEKEPIDTALAAETVQLHNQLVQIVYREKGYELEADSANLMFSFKIAQKAGMELEQRQALLELDSENARLHVLRAYFMEVIPKLVWLSEVERVTQSDGYIVN